MMHQAILKGDYSSVCSYDQTLQTMSLRKHSFNFKRMKNVLCTICMRGGSKGVSGKNLRKLNGKPLMAYTIEQALQSAIFQHVVVSTDSTEIAETAKQYGAETWFLRPDKLATDMAPKSRSSVMDFWRLKSTTVKSLMYWLI